MTSSETRATVKPSSPVPSRSLLSRLKAPLSSKTRNYTEFYIQPDDPHRQYTPGDIISGTVILKVLKPLRITHLVVSLHGYAQVYKNPNAPGDGYKNYSSTVGLGKGKRGGSYFGNGFVSLFEDEIVLCGEGRLSEGVYHFNFELEFPSKGLPSSIDFERGTVSYLLTATLTRPTTMSPTTSCDAKVTFMDSVDIARIPEPKPRVISLEPISRRSRPKTPRKRPDPAPTISVSQTPTGSEAPGKPPMSEPSGALSDSEVPRSPSPSDVSYESQVSSGNASGTEYGIRSVNTAPDGFIAVEGARATSKGKTITATIDVLQGGFLRGDQIPVKITVNHTKHVRSLKGIIVTLYRQARVDMHPALPVAPNSKGDKKKTEDYYPKSRTGLGGLSLSSAGSSHLFRKDLSQSFAPLFVDPRTLTAEVKCAVRVPDEAFPTMSNVPGAMISFKYYIEVVVDIQGKLTGLDRMVANAGLVPSISGAAAGTGREDATSNMYTAWSGNFVDTDQIRREKGVVSSLFEVIIGTKDSERNGKRKQTQVPQPSNDVQEVSEEPTWDPNAAEAYNQEYYDYDEHGQYYDHHYDHHYDPSYYDVPGYEQHGNGAGSSYHAPPQLAEEENKLPEKERMRRAEARLLPSQPPDVFGTSSAPPGVVQASAPILPEEDDLDAPYNAAGPSSSRPSHAPPPFHTASSSSRRDMAPPTQYRTTGHAGEDTRSATTTSSTTISAPPQSSSAPRPATSSQGEPAKPLPPLPPQPTATTSGTVPEYLPSSPSHVQPTDDKQEMQLRRLELERSAPPGERDEEATSSLRPSAPPVNENAHGNTHLVPSAPMLDDDDEGLVDAVRRGRSTPLDGERRQSEALPEYQR